MRLRSAQGEYELHQWSNDWIMAATTTDSRAIIVNPLSVQLRPAEVELMRVDCRVAAEEREAGRTPRSGFFWLRYELSDKGYFTRRAGSP